MEIPLVWNVASHGILRLAEWQTIFQRTIPQGNMATRTKPHVLSCDHFSRITAPRFCPPPLKLALGCCPSSHIFPWGIVLQHVVCLLDMVIYINK